MKSSEIEGEKLDAAQVRSSIARRLSIETAGAVAVESDVEGIVEMMLDATQNHATPLSDERLLAWHAAMFPTAHSGMRKIIVGAWRNDAHGPMQVVSGPVGKEKVDYEASAARCSKRKCPHSLLRRMIAKTAPTWCYALLSPIWFVTIHPFDGGNGRIARAIADWTLGQQPVALLQNVRTDPSRGERLLQHSREGAQKGTLDVTPWMEWFLGASEARLTERKSRWVQFFARRASGRSTPARAGPLVRGLLGGGEVEYRESEMRRTIPLLSSIDEIREFK